MVKALWFFSIAALCLTGHSLPAQAQKPLPRPPQYVALAFDGSYTLSTWEQLRQYSKRYQTKYGQPVKYTFFINPVYLLDRTNNAVYTAPGERKGSAIGWGDSRIDIAKRLQQMNSASLEGHEIGSHAVGHWDGSGWSAQQWSSELSQFDSILDRVFDLNKLKARSFGGGLVFRPSYPNFNPNYSIIGFRAPQLGVSPGLYKVLPGFGYKYDTSQIASRMDAWPLKTTAGYWNVPLARIPIPGTAKFYPTMDYNFCVNDSIELLKRVPELLQFSAVVNGKKISNANKRDCLPLLPDNLKQFIKERMKKAYLNYFYKNYHGNRAPLSIGHHFSPWMSGAYFEAMMEVTEQICRKPEVRCVTNRELVNILETPQMRANLAVYRAGQFAKLPVEKAVLPEKVWRVQAKLSMDQRKIQLSITGTPSDLNSVATQLFVNNQKVGEDHVDLADLRSRFQNGESVRVSGSIYNRQGEEILSVTHDLFDLGSGRESLSEKSLEDLNQGDSAKAHQDEASMGAE